MMKEQNPKREIKSVEHLYQIYPSMPRYANDPSESQIVKTYDFLLRRFQHFYSHPPTYFVKSGTSPLLFGDQHPYYGYSHLSFSSNQDIIVAVSKIEGTSIRINNYQTAVYGEKVLSGHVEEWKLEEKVEKESDRFCHGFVRVLGIVSEELSLKDLGGLDILIYAGGIEDRFIGWKQALYACFYTAIITVLTKNKPVDSSRVSFVLGKLALLEQEIVQQPQMLNYKYGHFTLHNSPTPKELLLPQNLSMVIAHSMTPLPKKLIQGKRFNLRRCEVLIALEYLKTSAGTTKNFNTLKQLQTFIGCSTEELLKQVQETLPLGDISSSEIETFADRSLIDILRQVPFANNVIDQNQDYRPRDRALFFLQQQLLIEKLSPQNLIESVRLSHRNQVQLLGIGSEQIDELIQVVSPWSMAHKIVGNGWGGNVIFLCEKDKAQALIEQAISKFYLSEQNKILLSDDLQQYIQLIDRPHTGLAILDPQSQIWY